MSIRSQNITPILAQADIFHDLDAKALQRVMALGVLSRHESDGIVFHQDDPAERMYLLVDGRLRLLQLTLEGAQINMGLVSPGQAIAIISLLERQRYPVSAQAVGAAAVLSWSRRDLHSLMASCPQIALNALKELSIRMSEFQDRLRELTTERVERRIARGLLRLARQAGRKTEEGVLIDLPVSRQDLAEMTGTTLFTVSRTLSQWEGRGIISAGRERILVRIPHGLVTIAEDLPPPRSPGADS